jgi:hypothetical protein
MNSCVILFNETLNVDSKHGDDVCSHDDLEKQHTIMVLADGLVHDRQLPSQNSEITDTVNANRRLRKRAAQHNSEPLRIALRIRLSPHRTLHPHFNHQNCFLNITSMIQNFLTFGNSCQITISRVIAKLITKP